MCSDDKRISYISSKIDYLCSNKYSYIARVIKLISEVVTDITDMLNTHWKKLYP
jgi:hypothetical protein